VAFPALKSLSLGLAYSLYAAFALLSLLFLAKFVRGQAIGEAGMFDTFWSATVCRPRESTK